ncbi:uncharacterized protein TNCV_3077101 [Trichonephila clavipes]|nr:uncharacterized protein TNCV_3077101 [Trichonephila clavipes]
MIEVLSPFLETMGYGFSWNYEVVLVWGGLRGAVGLALVMIAQHSTPPLIASQLLTQVSGIIFLTLVFNAPTMRIILKFLGIGKVTAKNVKYMTQAINLLRDMVSMTEKVTRMDKHMTGVDWMWVRSVTHIKNPYENIKGSPTENPSAFDTDRVQCSSCKTEIKIEPNEEEVRIMEEDSRFRILRAFECSIWNQHSRYGILRRTLRHLNNAVENTIDEPGRYLMTEDITEDFLIIGKLTQYMRKIMTKIKNDLRIENRQSMAKLYLMNLQEDVSGLRKWCLASYVSQRYGVILFWVMLLNVIPIAAEIVIFSLEENIGIEPPSNKILKEFLVLESLNAVAAFFYLSDTFVGMISLGVREYFHSHGNKIDFFVTLVVVIQAIFFIVVISGFRMTYPVIYALIALSCLRLLQLLRVILHGIFITLMDEVCSVIYNAYDFAVGFIVANEEIAKHASKTVDYEPSADLAQFTSENNISQSLKGYEKRLRALVSEGSILSRSRLELNNIMIRIILIVK